MQTERDSTCKESPNPSEEPQQFLVTSKKEEADEISADKVQTDKVPADKDATDDNPADKPTSSSFSVPEEDSGLGTLIEEPLRRKRRVRGERVCGVCGDIARSHNFGALTCETCKAFFRRNALKITVHFFSVSCLIFFRRKSRGGGWKRGRGWWLGGGGGRNHKFIS